MSDSKIKYEYGQIRHMGFRNALIDIEDVNMGKIPVYKPIRGIYFLMHGDIIVYVGQSNDVPAQYVLKIEKLTGISRYEIRPDVFLKEK